MASLRVVPKSRKGRVALISAVLAVIALVFAGVRSASAVETLVVTTSAENDCTTFVATDGTPEVRSLIRRTASDSTTLYDMRVYDVTLDGTPQPDKTLRSLVASGTNILWGSEWYGDTSRFATTGSYSWEYSVNGAVVGGGSSTFDCNTVRDDDGDGVVNASDKCPGTSAGTSVDANGCPVVVVSDDDKDGVPNSLDQCPGTPQGAVVDANGCSWSQRDDDGDGVLNGADKCADTPAGETVDSNGCSLSQIDTDSDGVFDSVDQCPTQAGSASNGGCPVTNPDVTYLVSGKIGKICQTARGCKTTIVVNHLNGQTAPILTAELSSGKTLSVKPRRESVNTSVYTVSFSKGESIVSVSAVLPPGAELH